MPASERNPATRPRYFSSYTGGATVQASSLFFKDLVRVAVHQPAENGHPQDADIQPRGPVRDVVKVVLKPLSQRSVAPPAVDLRPPGNPGFHAMAGHVVRDRLPELMDEHWPLRPRTDQAHVATQDVDQLRQLVEAGPPQE